MLRSVPPCFLQIRPSCPARAGMVMCSASCNTSNPRARNAANTLDSPVAEINSPRNNARHAFEAAMVGVRRYRKVRTGDSGRCGAPLKLNSIRSNAGCGRRPLSSACRAISKLAVEAMDNGLLAPELAAGIQRVKSAKTLQVRTGNWLNTKKLRRS